jgi:guanylate cyclase
VETRIEKQTVLLVAGSCCLAGVIWSLMYLVIFGPGLIAIWPLLFVIIVGIALAVAHVRRNHYIAIYAQIICIIYISSLLQWTIGDVFASGIVIVWAFIGPLTALLFFSFRQASFWLLVFLINVGITVSFNDIFAARGEEVSEATQLFFFYTNLTFAATVVFVFSGYFVRSAVLEREKANALLLNVLPKEIAPILKSGQKTIADHHDSVSVLFADIVDSTPLFADLSPAEAVDWLNECFSRFDRLVEKYGLEKIRTVGDNYMIAAGAPNYRPDHAQAMANMALDMVVECRKMQPRNGKHMMFRVGIHSGPLVAGVIGTTKFHYDLWGDTVNIASRMESQGQPGCIQVSEPTYLLLQSKFEFEQRGPIEIKGKGPMPTYFLLRRR